MNAPAVPGRGPRVEGVLLVALAAVLMVVGAGFLFDLPYGFGGWDLALIAAPVVIAGLAVAALMQVAQRRGRPRSSGRDRDRDR